MKKHATFFKSRSMEDALKFLTIIDYTHNYEFISMTSISHDEHIIFYYTYRKDD